jgi:CHAT domain-containing protein
VAHFACHGVSDWTTPQSSRLLLSDHLISPLTIEEISDLNLDADLAFLSACETTDAPARLADEVVHITSAFQLAGFRQVIGTLWPINDKAARQVATEVYAKLTEKGARPIDTGNAAAALHTVIRKYRDNWAPTRWAAHVHVGA